MDSNKDEAQRCINIALNAIINKDQDKARRFLEKAQRLFPTDKAKSTLNVDPCGQVSYISRWALAEADLANISITRIIFTSAKADTRICTF